MGIKAKFTAGLLSVTGDNADDAITVTRDAAGQIVINGNGEAIPVPGDPPTLVNTREIDVFGGNGNDTISLDNVVPPAGQALPTAHLFGGNGNDTLIGGAGDDILDGGNGDDTVIGGKGTDTAFLGNGNDTFIWNPLDGNDIVEGGAGFDTLDFHGKNGGETIEISPNGSAVEPAAAVFKRAGGTIDLNGVERIQFEAQGQHSDNITIDDLTGTDVKQVAIDLGARTAGVVGDGFVDTVSIKAPDGQAITVFEQNGVVTVSGLASTVTISNFEINPDGTNFDQLSINGQSVKVVDGQSVTVDTGGTSTANDGSHAAALLGQFMASSLVTAGDSHSGTPLADPPPNQPPLLTQPHA